MRPIQLDLCSPVPLLKTFNAKYGPQVRVANLIFKDNNLLPLLNTKAFQLATANCGIWIVLNLLALAYSLMIKESTNIYTEIFF